LAPTVAKQAPSPAPVQRGFFGKVWGGIKKGAKAVGHAVVGAGSWVGERMRDAAMWVVNLVRDLPERLARLAVSLWEGLKGVVTFITEAIQALASGGMRGLAGWLWEKAKAGGAWVLTFLSRVFDLRGGPEVAEFLFHLFSHASPLTGTEIAAGSSVLGPTAVRWGDVRVADGGFLSIVFHFNDARSFTTFHTMNMPAADRAQLDIVVHELTHVDQYEKVGSLYLGQAIHAQATIGYGYGLTAGLTADRTAGKHYRDYTANSKPRSPRIITKSPPAPPIRRSISPSSTSYGGATSDASPGYWL